MGVVPKWVFRCIEHYLYNYFDEKRQLEHDKQDIIESSPPELEPGGNGKSRHGDPTAIKGIKVSSGDIRMRELWLSIVDDILADYRGTEYEALIQKRYFDQLGYTQICMELNISQPTFFRWRNEIVEHGINLAISKGLVRYNDLRRKDI
ncbi:DUF1492 domain-containing protein [Mahella australiensis]|uniref:RinA family phage transcriptional regulator n=1 Tax=Mahella australiensis (strain DSM 15567 / CIP 107919 / 50-1 BON) TaxID=697281 RepID=F3ZZF7_MAHA5|nr:DUF1492 domain-containing protein [Mahella australiensis]AEE95767.1 RinA family phage transcriptional regulator [Mahella australiensis 50-1 BON]